MKKTHDEIRGVSSCYQSIRSEVGRRLCTGNVGARIRHRIAVRVSRTALYVPPSPQFVRYLEPFFFLLRHSTALRSAILILDSSQNPIRGRVLVLVFVLSSLHYLRSSHFPKSLWYPYSYPRLERTNPNNCCTYTTTKDCDRLVIAVVHV